MAIVRALSETVGEQRRLALASPVTGLPIGTLDVADSDEVARAVGRARATQTAWAARGIGERAALLRGAIDVLSARRAEIAETIQAETGKPMAEALGVEIVPACDFLNYWSGRARRDLRPHRQRLHGYLRPFKRLHIQYQPLGVVAVITPWNAPFVLTLNPVVQALLAGNTVVFKPSEVTPRSGEWVARVLHEAGVPEDVVQVLHGDGETGAALVNSELDKVCFTGSVATGRKIASACAGRFVPCTLELGGKDAMIVCADADLERAAAGAVYLSMFNTGQVCMSVERIYVIDSVADEFIDLVVRKASAVSYGPGNTDMGPLFWDRQLDLVTDHVADAAAAGAQILVGGSAAAGDGLYFKPTVISGAHHGMRIVDEETFGPIATIVRVRDEDEAIQLANDSRYGLSGSVFTKDRARARRIAARLATGSVVHNDAAVVYGVPEAPFGGRKDSGVGQVNGVHALRGYTHAQPVLIDRWQPERESIWYPYTDKTIRYLDGLIRAFGNRLVRRLLS
ncbi:aldehyde dehydrogenase family protein [Nocardia tengchongensis]|uniref:aldehyde dehydrogenase family protein n=1 Tax=Nocardia tengchongensis TaxID=2055889 RepID=UPI0036C3EAB4